MQPNRLSVDELIRRAGDLPPMPQVAQKALALIRDPDSNMSEIASVLAMDQVMTGLVLRWANSAYYGLITPVATVHQAVTYLGQNTVQSLILTAAVATYLDRPVPGYALDRGELWKHSVGVAAGARVIAAKFGRAEAEEAYHAGLLCDIGKLAFEGILRNTDTSGPEWQGKSFADLESYYFGIDHARLGSIMGKKWKLPNSLLTAIAFHHSPSKTKEYQTLTSAVHVADAAMMMMGIGIGKDGLQYEIDPEAVEILGFRPGDFEALIIKVTPLVKEAEQFIGLMRGK